MQSHSFFLSQKFKVILVSFYLLTPGINAYSQAITPDSVDRLVERTLKTFDVPGIAVAIVKDDKIVYEKGYGVRSLNTGKKVNENTLFGIASNSKAFTVAALGILAYEGKLKLDDKVTDYIPEFKMYDPYVTAEFTIRDLLTHRSGLGLGAGDLMDWPDSTNFTMGDVIHNLRYLKPVSSFRSKYDYDNQLYKVAGEIVKRVSGMSWEDFVETRIMKPLHMDNSVAAYQRLKDHSNVVDAHSPVDGKVVVIPRFIAGTGDAAAGVYSSVADLSKWVIVHMNNGKYGDSSNLFSEAIHQEMWSPQTIIPTPAKNSYHTHFTAYGLGFVLSDVNGYKEVNHTGGIDGMVTKITMLPELKLAIIVLTNQQSGAAFSAVTNQIKDSYLGVNGRDWVKIYADNVKASRDNADKVTSAVWKQVAARKLDATKTDLTPYTGTYHDNWLGDAVISLKDGQLWITCKRSPKLTGQVFPYIDNTFVIRWNYRSMEADAFAMFSPDENGKPTEIKLKPVSPLTDFSFDFQDLDFHKVK
ncbi:CubicO group peptidase (beta-lactamase class C family) [Mucilaginibacter frigoritolerans]|uniref:CubicO group peptidase (Beta-lactamase class C family) n=1 Tax=Mucilaginibacter frigoritolerans TaxID=652788 RepID=A0A562UGZ1_9SPHI|nr:serine hydrolase [Mucilaginibacter frigoritolerans]TWJ04321.1 CubicO group peptidase (beta-lactamase class C family) [Mucilaginibacter frigoritolerans]